MEGEGPISAVWQLRIGSGYFGYEGARNPSPTLGSPAEGTSAGKRSPPIIEL